MPRTRKKSYICKSKYMALRRSLETPEQRATRLEKSRIRAAERIACESEQERCTRLALARQRVNSRRANLKYRAKSFNLCQVIKPSSDSVLLPEEKISGLNKNQKAGYEAFLILKTQREVAAKNAKIRRSQETPEQRTARLEKGRIRAAMLRARENEEERGTRLARQRVRTYIARLYKANKVFLEQFYINKIISDQIALRQHYIGKQSNQYEQCSNIADEVNMVTSVTLEHSSKQTTDYEQTSWEQCDFTEIDQQRLAYQAYLLEETNRKREDTHVECEVTIEEEDEYNYTKSLTKEESFPGNKIETVFCNCAMVKEEDVSTENNCDGTVKRMVSQGNEDNINPNNQGLLGTHHSPGNFPHPLTTEDQPEPLNLTVHQARSLETWS